MPSYRHRQQRKFHSLRHGLAHFYKHHVAHVGHSHRQRSSRSASDEGFTPVPSTDRPHETRPAKARRPATRRRKARILLGLGIGVLLLVVVVLGISAYRSLSSARHSLDAARVLIDRDISDRHVYLSSAGRTSLAADLATVTSDADAAAATLHSSFGFQILGRLPYLNDQRNGILRLIADAKLTAATGSTLLAQVNTLVAHSSGTTVSLTALDSLKASVTRARSVIGPLNRPVGDLFGSLGTARRDFDRQIAKITTLLGRGQQTLGYALPFLGSDGPRTYLIAGENNSEMREQGTVLSYGVMTAQGGTFTLNATGSVDNIEPTHSVNVAIPANTATAFSGYGPTTIWQSVNASADFPVSGQIMQAMFAQVQGTHVDGVIAMDVPALASLLALTGPISVPNIAGQVSASNVADILLHEQYTQYAGQNQVERHDNISAVAKAVVDQMKFEHIDLAALANALAADVSGRHLIVWDDIPSDEATIRSLGASGAIDTSEANRTFHVAVENSTATKLDYYVSAAISEDVHVTPNGDALVNTLVTVENHTPAGLGPTYQTGPDEQNSFIPGQYVCRVLLWSPRGSSTPGSIAESGLELNQEQTSVLPQQSESVSFGTVIHHAVVDGQLRLRFVPQPRLAPDQLRVKISAPGWKVTGSQITRLTLNDTAALHWYLSK